MYKVQLFEGVVLEILQHNINNWMADHKDIAVVKAALTSVKERYHTFFILYTTTEAQVAELKEIAAELKPEDSVEAIDINPEVMKATS